MTVVAYATSKRTRRQQADTPRASLQSVDCRSARQEWRDDQLAALVGAVGRGSHEAWRQLLDRFNPWLVRVARGCGLHHSDVADVCQTTWLKLLEHLDRIREPERIWAWLAATARHESLHLLRRRCREVLTADHGELPGGGPARPCQPSPEDHALAAEQSRALWQAFRTLSVQQQRFLRMLMLEPPVSYREIADATGMRVGSIGPTRARCLERLRATPEIARLRSA
ncbi:MAG TPA: sigma-70 family RNA polymerase sigma factor [Actinomycetota bacterium]